MTETNGAALSPTVAATIRDLLKEIGRAHDEVDLAKDELKEAKEALEARQADLNTYLRDPVDPQEKLPGMTIIDRATGEILAGGENSAGGDA